MPFQIGSVAVHDDGQHFGSAKRDTALGVAGLSAAGNLLVPGAAVYLARNVANNVAIYEWTSGELVCFFTRVGANDYVGYVRVDGLVKILQHDGFKDVANGIAGLDASAEITSRLAYESDFTQLRLFPDPIVNGFTGEVNIDDRDIATSADCGSGTFYITYDLGAVFHVLFSLFARVGMYGDVGSSNLYIEFSHDNTTWYRHVHALTAPISTPGVWAYTTGFLFYAGFTRYIRIVAVTASAGGSAGSVNAYEAGLVY